MGTLIVLRDAIPHPRDSRAMVDTLTLPRDGDVGYRDRGVDVFTEGVDTFIPWSNVRCVRYVRDEAPPASPSRRPMPAPAGEPPHLHDWRDGPVCACGEPQPPPETAIVDPSPELRDALDRPLRLGGGDTGFAPTEPPTSVSEAIDLGDAVVAGAAGATPLADTPMPKMPRRKRRRS